MTPQERLTGPFNGGSRSGKRRDEPPDHVGEALEGLDGQEGCSSRINCLGCGCASATALAVVTIVALRFAWRLTD